MAENMKNNESAVDRSANPGESVLSFTESIKREIQEVLEERNIQQRVATYITSLAGKKFPVETADEEIRAIVGMVERANMEFWYNQHKINMYCDARKERKFAIIRVTTTDISPQLPLYQRTIFPILEVRSHI